jgi:hypothetical protein
LICGWAGGGADADFELDPAEEHPVRREDSAECLSGTEAERRRESPRSGWSESAVRVLGC